MIETEKREPSVDELRNMFRGREEEILDRLSKKIVAGKDILHGTVLSPYNEFILKIIFPQLVEGQAAESIAADQESSYLLNLFLTNDKGLVLAILLQKYRENVSYSNSEDKKIKLSQIDKILEELGVKHLVSGEEEINPDE